MRIQAKLKGFHLNEYMIQPILAHGVCQVSAWRHGMLP